MKRAAIAAAVLIGLAVVVWASLRGPEKKGKPVEVEVAGRRDVVARVKATATVNPRRKVEVQSKVIGEVVSVPVAEGDTVAAGQVVLEIEKALYQAARDQAKAALDQATVNLERTRAEVANEVMNLDRVSRLVGEGVLSQEALDRARLAHDSAEIAVRAQREAIEQARSAYRRAVEDLERTTIRAPMDGVVTALNVEKGETAIVGTMNFAGSVLLVIGDLSELIAEAEVAESEVVGLALGQPARVKVDALPDAPMAGRVVEIGSSGVRQADVVKFRVKVALDSPDPRVRPGMTAKVEITTEKVEDALAVAQQAVQTRWLDRSDKEVQRREGDASQREVSAVYLFRDGKATRREVTTGIHDELWAEVRGGLTEGDTVIMGPYRTLRALRDGDPVRVEKKKTESAKETAGGSS
ncbi:MAG: efflux RND transporter periplasmic adaptor subunit [Acidobacteriota bacterium]